MSYKLVNFLTGVVLLIASTTFAQNTTIGYSPPGPLRELKPDTEPPIIHFTQLAGVVASGKDMQETRVITEADGILISGFVQDDQEVFMLKINGQNIPLRGDYTEKRFGVKLRQLTPGRSRQLEFVAMDRSGNSTGKTYRLTRRSATDATLFEPVGNIEEEIADRIEPPPTQQAPAPPPQTMPRIWLFSVGISKFADPSLNLSYAASDAESFYEFYRSAKGARLPKTQATLLINETATRAEVIQSLAQTVKVASAQDLVVIFIATHGLPDADTGEINFLMHDTYISNLVATGLSQSDIQRIIDRSRAKKILFIVDACHSGDLGSGILMAQRGITFSEVNRLLSKLAQASDGIAILSASSANEASFEDEKWNGGVFTYYLLGGLNGHADTNKDQIVTLREAFDYLYVTVPKATQGRQHPELKGQFSNELPLVEVNP